MRGWEGVVSGDVPIGSGLSSSAALELVTARAFYEVSGFEWDAGAMALACQAAENEWLGVKCGIMDQMISAAGIADRALLIDCRSLETASAPLPPDTVVVILDTNTRRGLVDSKYNERRAQCEAAARHFGVPALRDVDGESFAQREHELEPLMRRRARHVITENERTLRARDAMNAGDPVTLGQLMIASHISLRDDFEVSSPALDAIVDCANAEAACLRRAHDRRRLWRMCRGACQSGDCCRICGTCPRMLRGSDGKRADHLCHWREPRSGNDLSLIGDPFSEKCV